MLITKRQVLSPNGVVITTKVSNSFKIKTFSAIERQVEYWLGYHNPAIKTMGKGLLLIFSFMTVIRCDMVLTLELLKSKQAEYLVAMPAVKLASYIIVTSILYLVLKYLVTLIRDSVKAALVALYTISLKHQWLPYRNEASLKEKWLSSSDVSYYPKRKYHRIR
ncbi:hypothetical protein ACXZ71_00955 [Streptococcus agalactiae]